MNNDLKIFTSGFVGCLSFQLFHPFELIKVRMQSMDGSKFSNLPYEKSYKSLLINMVKKEGIWSFYRGVIYTLPLNFIVGTFFLLHEKLKKSLDKNVHLKKRYHLNSMLSTSILGFLFSICLNPFYTIKVWIFLDTKKFNNKTNFLNAVRSIKKEAGLRGFYRGYFLTYFLSFNKTLSIFFNDFFKKEFNQFYSTTTGNFFLGGCAKIISSTITYPLSTIRTRVMQNQKFEGLNKELKYKNIIECAKLTFHKEGLRGFFNGYLVYAPKTFFNSAVLFTLYEKTYKFLNKN
jgi:hypothetical protein